MIDGKRVAVDLPLIAMAQTRYSSAARGVEYALPVTQMEMVAVC